MEPCLLKRFGGGSRFVAVASSCSNFRLSALDAVGDERGDDRQGSEFENAKDTSYGASIEKEYRLANLSHQNG